MKARNYSLAILVIISLALLVVAGPVSAKATRTYVTGTEGGCMPISGGTELYPDGNAHVRGMQWVCQSVADDPRLSGTDTLTINYNMRVVGPPAFITGPMWGTFHLVNDGGSWEGTWTGERDERGFAYVRAVGHGMGGYAGLHYEMQAQRLSPDPFAPFEFEASILDPGN